MTRMRISFGALSIALVILSACGDGGPPPGDATAPSRLEGPVVEVESEGLGQVQAFTVKSDDRTYEIFIAADVDYGFPLDHLTEHRISGEPVAVRLEERDGKFYALSIEDA